MNHKVKKMVGIALFTAMVVVLQLVGGVIKVGGLFSISLVLVPIVVGAAVYGWDAGLWLGFSFGAAVLLSGDAGPFMAIDVVGTVVTVLVKGAACGAIAGLAYKLFEKKSKSEPIKPSDKSSMTDTENIFRMLASFPFSLFFATIIDIATGSPAVATI